MEVSKSAGGVIVGPHGKIAVVNQDNITWSLPKGRLEQGEDEMTAAVREIEEETGLTKVKFIKRLGEYERHPMDKHKQDIKNKLRHVTFFLFTTEETELSPKDPANPAARWVLINEVEDLLTHRKDKEFFKSIKNQITTLP
jgi:ADP-ribose pyrophosphatase YjhB (NUDIX family)